MLTVKLNSIVNVRLEIFTAMEIHVTVFWITTPRSYVVGYRRFGGPCCLHLQSVHIHPDEEGTMTL